MPRVQITDETWLDDPWEHCTDAAVFINVAYGDGDNLTPEACDRLAAALTQAAARKRAMDAESRVEKGGGK